MPTPRNIYLILPVAGLDRRIWEVFHMDVSRMSANGGNDDGNA